MDKVAIYCRLSKEDKHKPSYTESESIQNQRLLLEKRARDEGWEIYDCYVDEDYSGSDRDRPEFNRMIEDAKMRKFNIILCKAQSRFARDAKIVNEYVLEKFIEWKIRFVTIVEGIDTKECVDNLNSQIIAVIDEHMLVSTSINIKATLRRKKEEGLFTGSMPPYGYKKDPNNKNHLVIDEEAAEIVRMIFEMVAEGYTYIQIATKLNEEGVPTPKQYKLENGYNVSNMYNKNGFNTGKWSRDIVRAFLKNEVYIGNLIQGKSHVLNFRTKTKEQIPKEDWIKCIGMHEPIISEELWNTVQNIIATRRRSSGVNKGKHPLSGKVYCKVCGRKFYRCKSGGMEYFSCSYARNIRDDGCNNHARLRLDVLESFVIDKINEVIAQYHDKSVIKKNIKDVNGLEHKLKLCEDRKYSIQGKMENVKNGLVRSYEDKLAGNLEQDIFDMIQKKYSEDKKRYTENLKKIDADIADIKKRIKNRDEKDDLLSRYTKIEKLTVMIVDEFVDNIQVGAVDKETKHREIIINLNI